MSGHSKWAKIHRKKGVADAKRGAIFTRFGNLITIAAKSGGSDLDSNFQLRLVVEKAKAVNMPKDNIEKAIKRGTGEGGDNNNIEEATYEFFGSKGVVFIVEAITDNKNRTVSDLKTTLSKNGANLGEPNSVLWMFDKCGIILIDKEETLKHDEDELELNLIEAGAQDIIKDDNGWEIRTAPTELQATENKMKEFEITTKESSLSYIAKDELKIEKPEDQEKVGRVFAALEEIDDVSEVYTNATW
jgi:YebC/PmpR family DNA-binding regulatory protein